MARSNRVAYELTYGPIPSGLHALHRCDNPSCCNPKHIFLGTHRENMADMARKGRAPTKAGAANQNAKLSDAQVTAIFLARGLQREIAAQFGITQSHVSRIKRGTHERAK